MKKIVINSDNRRFNISSIVVGYLDENKTEKIEFIIPDKYKEFGKKACFDANGQKFAKIFDDITGDTLTFTRDITKYKELEMSIEFFKIENEDEIIARTSNLHIIIENAVICNDDISPDEPKIIILDKLIEEVTKVGLEVGEKGNYAKEQGDYAKSQAENVISANTEAIKIINNFENNVEEYTTSFNENANNKTNDFDNNVVSKTSDFNQNVDNKIGEYNNNASAKLSTYNTNAENKKSEFDTNVANKTKTFNDNANSKTETYNNNHTEKLNAYNTNATSKLNNYNTNASTKLQEYNTNADNKIAEYDAHSQELNNKIVSTRNELERVKNDVLETGTDTDTYIHLEDSAMAEYQELSVDGVCEQKTTSIANGDEYDSPSPDYPQEIKTIENSLKITSCNKNLLPNYDYENKGTPYGVYATLKNNKLSIEKITENENWPAFILYADGTVLLNRYWPTLILINKSKGYFNNKNIDSILSIILNGTYTTVVSQKLRITLGYENYIKDYDYWSIRSQNVKIEKQEKLNFISIGFPKNCTFTDFSFDIQLEKNTTATLFEQHLETQITANLPEGEFIGKINDTYKDTLKVEYNADDGQYHLNLYKNVGKIVLNDYTNISIYSFNNMNGVQFKNVLNENYDCANGISNRSNLVGKKYIQNTIWVGVNSINVFWLGILDLLNITSVEDFKTWLSTHNTEVYYALKTPYVIDLGIVDMPITYNEITNLFTDSDLIPNINAKYYRNFITTIQNLQVNEKALKQELVDINARLSALESASASVVSESEVIE